MVPSLGWRRAVVANRAYAHPVRSRDTGRHESPGAPFWTARCSGTGAPRGCFRCAFVPHIRGPRKTQTERSRGAVRRAEIDGPRVGATRRTSTRPACPTSMRHVAGILQGKPAWKHGQRHTRLLGVRAASPAASRRADRNTASIRQGVRLSGVRGMQTHKCGMVLDTWVAAEWAADFKGMSELRSGAGATLPYPFVVTVHPFALTTRLDSRSEAWRERVHSV